jgi:hypothetical protein
VESRRQRPARTQRVKQKAESAVAALSLPNIRTVYKIDHSGVDGSPEVRFKCLKRLVGERGFEPPTPWSRTRCSTRLSHSPT